MRKDDMTNKLKRQCSISGHGRPSPRCVRGSHWLRTYCRHWATIGHDTQTIDNLNTDERIIAQQHIGNSAPPGDDQEGGFRVTLKS